MIANELERCAVEYLANAIVAGEEPIIVGDDNPVIVPLDNADLRIYRGEANVDLVHPSVVVSCEGGQEDFDTGNHTCTLEVLTTFQVDPATENPTPLSRLMEASTQIINHMLSDNIISNLNLYSGEHFTAMGVYNRTHRKSTGDRTCSHYMTADFYCAGRNLSPAI